MKPHFRLFLFVPLLLIYLNCDSDNFTGYKYESQQLLDTLPLSGIVVNTSTNSPVRDATVSINSFETATDENGNYLILYPYTLDDERDKPASIFVSAKKYFNFEVEKIIYPGETRLNFSLIYGAPIIESSWRYGNICEAIIFDYQGVDNITKVSGIFIYIIPQVSETEYEVTMNGVKIVSANSALYRCNFPNYIEGLGTVAEARHKITVSDKDGFSESMAYSYF